jgi:mRNA-degrading endonuclease RelE of RelBE toxin-antitoxin system
MNRWQFVLHQQALEEIDHLRPAARREVRATLLRLADDPWQKPDGQIRPSNDRVYLVKYLGAVRVIYWLDAFAREVCVVRVEQP